MKNSSLKTIYLVEKMLLFFYTKSLLDISIKLFIVKSKSDDFIHFEFMMKKKSTSERNGFLVLMLKKH